MRKSYVDGKDFRFDAVLLDHFSGHFDDQFDDVPRRVAPNWFGVIQHRYVRLPIELHVRPRDRDHGSLFCERLRECF